MASSINKNIQVKLDGQYVDFNSIEYKFNATEDYIKNKLDIKLVLFDGTIIYDNGDRVEIIVIS